MKTLFYVLLLISIVSSCKSNTKQIANDSTNVAAVPDSISRALIAKFKPVIHGVWVRSDYIKDLLKTHSPYISQEKLGGICSIAIGENSIKGDSVHAGVSLGDHEGGDVIIYLKKGINPDALPLKINDGDGEYYKEIGYVINKTDTSLMIYRYDKNKHLVDETRYTKTVEEEVDNDMGYGIQYITNNQLVTGKYTATDSTGAVSAVEFTNEGKITGFSNFNTYYITTDFVAGPENNIDEISFYVNDKQQQDLAFKIDADTLSLYHTTANAKATMLFLGKLAYKMVRR